MILWVIHVIYELYKKISEQVMLRLQGLANDEESNPGSSCMARARVQVYFDNLRETLQVQEAAALSAVDTHVRERLSSLRNLQEDLMSSLSQVAVICVQCEQAVRQDDARVISASVDINQSLNFIDKHKQMFNELGPEQLQPDSAIPITFTKVSLCPLVTYIILSCFNLLHEFFYCYRTIECILVRKWKFVLSL